MKNHLSAVFQPTPHGWNILISKSVGKRCPPKSQETDIVQALVKTKWIRGRLGTVGQRTNNVTIHLLYNELSFTKPWDELVCLEKIAASGKQKKKTTDKQTNKQNRVYFIIKTLRLFVNSWFDMEAAFLHLKW